MSDGATVTVEPDRQQAMSAHLAPFLVWLGLMILGDWLPLGPTWSYALRTAVVFGLLLALRPWRWYEGLQKGHIPAALLTGLAVFAVWVLPEAFGYNNGVSSAYGRWLILPLGSVPDAQAGAVFSPEQCGWALTTVRILGSGLVIAIAEEYFWRGFLYRWFIGRDFLSVSLGERDWQAVAWMTILFAAEHHRFLAGALAGLAYLELMRRTKSLHAAVLAHVLTNLLLGIYVVTTKSYQFW